ncbi:hypothetical protein BGZ94_006056 [Podila epigama]|nr:hypothetical protein BGZ94_006056 [Podila epigama]
MIDQQEELLVSVSAAESMAVDQPLSSHPSEHSKRQPTPVPVFSARVPVEAEYTQSSQMDVDDQGSFETAASHLTTTIPTCMDTTPASSSSSSPSSSSEASLSGDEPSTPTSPTKCNLSTSDDKLTTKVASNNLGNDSTVGSHEDKVQEQHDSDMDDMDDMDDNDDDEAEQTHEPAQQSSNPYSSSNRGSACSSSASLRLPSIITVQESVYYAVPISTELHIIPHSSLGFHWNEDLFLKPHQRRRLGVDAIQVRTGSTIEGSNNNNNNSSSGGSEDGQRHDSAIPVHEVHLCEQEMTNILPSWPWP